MTKTIFTRTYWNKGESTLMGHETLAGAKKWTAEGIRNGARSTIIWTGAQDRIDTYIEVVSADERVAA